MVTSTLSGFSATVVRVPRSTDNGLWSALAARVVEPAPARLQASVVVDRPAHLGADIIDMSAFRNRLAAHRPTAA